MNVYVVTEGKTDEIILRQLLRAELRGHSDQLRVIEAGGGHPRNHWARSILGSRRAKRWPL